MPTATPTVDARVSDLLARMTLAEKIGQMTQVEKNSIAPDDITNLFIGSLLSGGGGAPDTNTVQDWAAMVDGFQQRALATRLGIPLIYGVDAVHGHNNLRGATIFPHNVGLGAARDPDLVQRIGRATAEELAATGIPWDFAPVVAVPQDIRWGRAYEGYSEDTALVTQLSTAYLRGLQGDGLGSPLSVLATPKHFIGDGGTALGSAAASGYLLDQGDTRVDEAALRALFLPPYQAAVDAGAQSIMVSFSSWQGMKMHANKYLLTDVLKGELGFSGFLISDWMAINQLPGDYHAQVAASINAGLDMVMVPTDYKLFITTLTQAVEQGDVPQARIDDAVRRILRVKFELGLFDHPLSDPANRPQAGADAHRQLARQAVRETAGPAQERQPRHCRWPRTPRSSSSPAGAPTISACRAAAGRLAGRARAATPRPARPFSKEFSRPSRPMRAWSTMPWALSMRCLILRISASSCWPSSPTPRAWATSPA